MDRILLKNFKFTYSIDIVILDIQMPKMNGFETLRWIKRHHPETKVLMLSISKNPFGSDFMKEVLSDLPNVSSDLIIKVLKS